MGDDEETVKSPYLEIENVDPKEFDMENTEDIDQYDEDEDVKMNGDGNSDSNEMTMDKLLAVCTERDLYILRMEHSLNDTERDYVMAKVLYIRNVYDHIDRNYIRRSQADRLQFLRYIPELSVIVCASSAYPCVAVLQLYREDMMLKAVHHGFYPEHWKEMNVQCGKRLFLAGMDIMHIRCCFDPKQTECHRIVLLYHSGLISIVDIRKEKNQKVSLTSKRPKL